MPAKAEVRYGFFLAIGILLALVVVGFTMKVVTGAVGASAS